MTRTTPVVRALLPLLMLSAFMARPARAAGQDGMAEGPTSSADSADVAAVVGAFHDALARGDSLAAVALLAPDVRVLEAGGVETKDAYRAHHLPADMAFAAAVRTTRSPLWVRVRGDAAWAVSTSRVRGTFRGRDVDARGAELVVLSRGPGGWRIEALHWSSR